MMFTVPSRKRAEPKAKWEWNSEILKAEAIQAKAVSEAARRFRKSA